MSDKGQQTDGVAPVVDIGEDINVTTILTVGVVTALIIVVVVIALVGLFNQTAQQEVATKMTAAGYGEQVDLSAEQRGRLGSYGWVDRGAGVVSIPIERAIELAMAKLAAGEQFFSPAVNVEPAAQTAGAVVEEEGQ